MTKIDVLDHGFVELVDLMGSDLTVVNAARCSHGSRSQFVEREKALALFNKMTQGEDVAGYSEEYLRYFDTEMLEGGNPDTIVNPKDFKLINFLAKHKHWSPFRHCQVQFHCKVPEFVARQWYKHVVGIAYSEAACVDHAWNEISGRYVELSTQEVYIPSEWRTQAPTNRQASTDVHVDDPHGRLHKAVSEHHKTCFALYSRLLSEGVAKEQARSVLPFALYTEFYWTVSLQAFANFLSLRDKPDAQWEIQTYSQAMRQLLLPHFSVSLEALCK
jgi:thymidylate synthase (FAD)